MARAFFALLAGASALLIAGCAPGRPAPGFTLTDDAGQAWTLSAQHGTGVLLTFGFTHCRDTCPTTVAKLVRVAAAMDARAHPTEVVFVTVDPQRDTPAVLHRFLGPFARSGIVGLTGAASRIDAVENAYHVWAQRLPGRAGGYDEAHSAVIFFIDASGQIRALRDDDDSLATLMRTASKTLG